VALYDALLRLYPASFRREYGSQMAAVFLERRRRANNPFAVAMLWLEVVFDTLRNAGPAHWDILRQDLRYSARTLTRSPGFALTVIAVVALGVGANTAAFTLADHVLIRPMPYSDPDRLVRLWESPPGYTQMELSPPNYRDWKRLSTCFLSMGAYTATAANLVGLSEPVRLEGMRVTSEVMPTLGVTPRVGRLFTAEDDREGAPGTVVLSFGLWQSAFGGDGGVIDSVVRLNHEAFQVIGVMGPEFHFPTREAQFWIPMRFSARAFEDRNNNMLDTVARLRPSVTLEQARQEMRVIAAQMERAYPLENEKTGATVNRLRDQISQSSRLLLVALLAASACVLLIACTNLSNLLLARAKVRERELAVRTALGAGRERLVRQLLTECFVLSTVGGALGLAAANIVMPLFERLVPESLPIAGMPAIDWRVLAFAAAITGLTSLGFGLLPAFRASGGSDVSALRESARGDVGGRRERLRSALVIVEVTMSVALLLTAGLLIRALARLNATDPGFRADGVVTLGTALPMPKYQGAERRVQFYQKVLTGVKALPGVENAAYISFLPMTLRGGIWPVSTDGRPQDRAGNHTASLRFVTPGFFATLGIPVRAGRDVAESDTRASLFAAVVSESFAKQFWPGEYPLGKRFNFAFFDRTVVGVVGDVRVRGLERMSEPQVYLPYKQVPDGGVSFYQPKDLAIRSSLAPEVLLPAIRRIVREADPDQPISQVRTLADIVAADTAPRRVQVRLLSGLAALALLLAGLGIHGVLSFMVSHRTQEIGVRIALGARPGNILGMVLREGLSLAGIGLAAGLACGYFAGRMIETLLVGVNPTDAVALIAAVGSVGLATLTGIMIPAIRAVRVDPMTSIRG
jgi:putative ABC transport system permease protein